MLGESHALLKDFASQKDVIINLLGRDERFSTLAKEYDTLDEKLCDIEEKGVPISDTEFKELKTHRAALKDQLFSMIDAAK